MCSAPRSDLTARARIRNAAILRFGRDGFGATTIRGIATEAAVSLALVIHHFSNKEQLRQACDDYVTGELLDSEEDAAGSDLVATMRRWLSNPEQFQPSFDYLTRMLGEDSTTSGRLFDDLVARTERTLLEGAATGLMRPVTDSRATAVLLA